MEDIIKTIDGVLTQDFIEDFIKERIYSEFLGELETLYMHDFLLIRAYTDDSILTMARFSEEVYQYAITGVVVFDMEDHEMREYNITGIITTLNGGKVRISGYGYSLFKK